MIGDKYQVFYHIHGRTEPHGDPVDTWTEAKEARNTLFFGNGKLRAVWIMRSNPSLGLRPEHYGNTLRRTKYEATA